MFNFKRLKSIILIAVILITGCKKKDGCNDSILEDKTTLFLSANVDYSKTYYDLPKNIRVMNKWGFRISKTSKHRTAYKFSNEVYKVNGVTQSIGNPVTDLKLGNNTLTYTGDCIKPERESGEDYSCDCDPNLSKASLEIELVDTVKLWIKKISFTKQYKKQGLSYPDLYFRINNKRIGLRRSYSKKGKNNYDAKTMGAYVWDINDTITISDKYFNLSLTAWDYDWPSKDYLLYKYLIKAEDVKNWATGTHSHYHIGAFIFEVERIK